ncbi:MAG: hypothetical protein M1828_003870 [Chrysothrix sp. TS-e1954]|nr:MAG: hypothetical protein M1828_003870 [Chrysothrix sp. TS-e1954]
MATTAHCIYCFEVIHAQFEEREPMRLAEVEATWNAYHDSLLPPSKKHPQASPSPLDGTSTAQDDGEAEEDVEQPSTTSDDEAEAQNTADGEPEDVQTAQSPTKRPKRRRKSLLSVPNLLQHRQQMQPPSQSPSRSHLVNASNSGSGSGSSASSTPSSTLQTPASSTSLSSASSSLSSLPTASPTPPSSTKPVTESPMFVTWNSVTRSSYTGRTHKSLRGCIGTFETQPIEKGLRTYARMAAFEDTRFSPLPSSLLSPPSSTPATPGPSQLHCNITLLLSFEACAHPLDWTLGIHGIRLSFTDPLTRRRLGSTYLPDVPVEQGWRKTETMVSLMRKAGWEGRAREWEDVARRGGMEVVRYKGVKAGVGVEEWAAWRGWVGGRR